MTVVDELLAQGRQHAKKRAWDAAIVAYREVLDLEPENTRASVEDVVLNGKSGKVIVRSGKGRKSR